MRYSTQIQQIAEVTTSDGGTTKAVLIVVGIVLIVLGIGGGLWGLRQSSTRLGDGLVRGGFPMAVGGLVFLIIGLLAHNK